MKKYVFLIVIIMFIGEIKADHYYVNPDGGDDGNSGKSDTTAWKSFSKINDPQTPFNAGDIISFKCGTRFYGQTLVPPRDNLTFNSYGSGPRPVIDRDSTQTIPISSNYCVEMASNNHQRNYITFNGIKFVHGNWTDINMWNCSYITFESCNIDSAYDVPNHADNQPGSNNMNLYSGVGSNLTVRNCTMSYAGGSHGIYVDGTDNTLLEYDTLLYNAHDGFRIAFGNDYDWTDNLTIRYCISKFNKYAQLEEDGARNSKIYYNVFEMDPGYYTGNNTLLHIHQDLNYHCPQSNVYYYNNTFIGHNYGFHDISGVELKSTSGMQNIVFKNNIFYYDSNVKYGLYLENWHQCIGTPICHDTIGGLGSFIFQNNLYYTPGSTSLLFHSDFTGNDYPTISAWNTATGYEANSNYADPNFNSGDYSLQNSSPAILSGVWVDLDSAHAINEKPIGNPPDIGAYQNASYLSGTIPTTTLNGGNIAVTGTVTAPIGTTLTIYNGAKLWFASACSLLIYGHLYSYGTSSIPVTFTSLSGTSGGSWGTITLNDSGANGSYIRNCIIQYGTEIDVIGSNNVTIQNCNITNSSMHGINFSGSTGSYATNDTIRNTNTAHGIIVQNSANVNCSGNTIVKTNTNHNGVGIYFGGGSLGVAALNDIRGFNWGICANWGSSPTSYNGFGQTINNRITKCSVGLDVYASSYPTFGTPLRGDAYGKNSLDSNTINAAVGISHPEYDCELDAYDNWWGSYPPDASLFSVGSLAIFDYHAYLQTDPWVGLPLPSIKQNSAGTSETDLKNQTACVLSTNVVANGNSSIDNSADMDSVFIGINLLNNNNSNAAKDFYISYLKQHPDNQAAYTYLYNCADSITTPEIISFFSSLPLKASKEQKLLLSYLYEKQGNIELAKDVNNQVIKENLNTPLAVRAKLNNFFLALYDNKDLKTATSLLNDVISQSSLSTPMEISLAEDALSVYGSVISANSKTQLTKQVGNGELPTSYSLFQNYPNPFNPSTTIRYQIPKAGLVTLKVYDILGREITTLVNENKIEGSYDYSFSASRFPSGVYIYQIRVNDYVSSKKMILIK